MWSWQRLPSGLEQGWHNLWVTLGPSFGGNFDPSPLCGEHPDLQELCFQCPEVVDKIQVNELYENIFKPKITSELATNLQEILKIREKA